MPLIDPSAPSCNPYTGGLYYAPRLGSSPYGTYNSAIYAQPYRFRGPAKVAGLAIASTDGTGSGANLGFGIYKDNGSFAPAASPLASALPGAVNFGANQVVAGLFDEPLLIPTGDLYWFVFGASEPVGCYCAPQLGQYGPQASWDDVGCPTHFSLIPQNNPPGAWYLGGEWAAPWTSLPPGTVFTNGPAQANPPIISFLQAEG